MGLPTLNPGAVYYSASVAARTARKTGLAASTALVSKYKATTDQMFLQYRWMRLRL